MGHSILLLYSNPPALLLFCAIFEQLRSFFFWSFITCIQAALWRMRGLIANDAIVVNRTSYICFIFAKVGSRLLIAPPPRRRDRLPEYSNTPTTSRSLTENQTMYRPQSLPDLPIQLLSKPVWGYDKLTYSHCDEIPKSCNLHSRCRL